VSLADQVQPPQAEALARWQAAGVDTARVAGIDIPVADLGGTALGLASGRAIWLDANAATWGRFVDAAVGGDSEFTTPGDQGEQQRTDLFGSKPGASGVTAEPLAAGTRLAASRGTDADTSRLARDTFFAWLADDAEAPWVGSNRSGRGRQRR
jgi:hypothetical protein